MNTNSRFSKWLEHIDFIVFDLIALELSYYIVNLIYHEKYPGKAIVIQQHEILALCLLITLLIGHPFKGILNRNKWTEIRLTLQHTMVILILNVIFMYFTRIADWMSRLTIGLTFVLYFIIGFAMRVVWKKVLRRKILNGDKDKCSSMLVLCSRDTAEDMISNLSSHMFNTYLIKGIFFSDYDETRDSGSKINGIPVRGHIDCALEYATHSWVDEVLFDSKLHGTSFDQLEDHFEKMGITTHRVIASLLDDARPDALHVERIGNFIVTTHTLRDVAVLQLFCKRALDICGAIVGLLITGIVYIFVAPQIYFADPGPIFYSANRVGKNGRLFKMYKFRSMYQNADARKAELMSQNKMQGLMFKMDDDPRIIGSEKKDANGKPKGIGNFIRKTSLDEFPQFWNVLKGDMSLVGTRPPTIDEWEQYSEHHRIRLSMRPGITGMWQVSGRSDITDFEEVVRLDEKYIETWTVGMDIRILFQTVFAVLQHKGAE